MSGRTAGPRKDGTARARASLRAVHDGHLGTLSSAGTGLAVVWRHMSVPERCRVCLTGGRSKRDPGTSCPDLVPEHCQVWPKEPPAPAATSPFHPPTPMAM